jgi:hypothetical protein
MYIDGIWRKLVNFENIGTGTVLTFSDGTTKVIDEERYDEKFRVREIDMDYFDQPDQDKTDMVQQILDERPDLYDRIYDAFQTMMSDDTDQEAYKVYNWLTRFWNGRETYASFPEQAVEQVVEEEEPVVEQVGEEDGKVSIEEDDGGNVEFVTYNGHRFHIDEVVGHSDKFQTKVEDYLRDEHGIDVPFADITPEQFPFLSFNEDGEPALFGDKDLHDDLGLDPNIRVAKDADGNVHQIWTPPTEVPKELLAK